MILYSVENGGYAKETGFKIREKMENGSKF